MELRWYGHACFLITTEKSTKIITDPYEPGFGGKILYGPVPDKADIVTVSHDHGDHNYVEGLPGKPQVIKGPGRHEAKGMVFEGIATYHDESGGSQRGTNTIFTFVADDIRVCHLGDLGHVLREQEVRAIGGVDVLLIPVGGFYTIGPTEATRVVTQLSPKFVVPMHFQTDKCKLPIGPVDAFLEHKRTVKKIDGSRYSLTKKDLRAGLEVVVLQPAL